MAISYYKLFGILDQKDITKKKLREAVKISTATLAKLSKDEPVVMKVIEDICRYLNCQSGDIMEIENDIIKAANHFRCLDYVLGCANDSLTEGMIKKLHLILKTGISDSCLDGFCVSAYNSVPTW